MEDKDLNKYEDIIAIIKKDGEKIEAPRAVLTSVLEKVTIKNDERYNLKKQGEVGRPSLLMGYINQFNLIMNKQYVVAVVVLAIVAAGGLYWYTQNPAVEPGLELAPTTNKVEKATSESLAVEVTSELANLEQDVADINDFNSAANDAELDALSKDLASIDSL